jgi:hypothetical protein
MSLLRRTPRAPKPAHDHRECPVCQGPDMSSRIDPIAVRWGLIVATTAVVLLVMPYSWVLTIVRASFTLGLLGLGLGLFVAFGSIVLRAAVGGSVRKYDNR